MFGPWGNEDEADSIRIIHRALDAGINFVDTADVYSMRRVGGDRRQGTQEPPRERLPRHQVLHAHGPGRPQPARRLTALDHPRGRELPAPVGHRSHRPLPGPPPEPGHRRRGDPRRTLGPRPPGQGPLHRLLVLLRLPDRRGPVGRAGAAPGAVRDRAAAVLAPGPRQRGRRPTHRSPPRHGNAHLQPAHAAAGSRDATARTTPPARPRRPGPRPAST